jgi:hypothetical protein
MLLKRWWFWLSLLTIVFLAAAVSFLAPDPFERAKTKFKQIEEGMTKAQVIEIMGTAPAIEAKWEDAPVCVWNFGGDTQLCVILNADLRVAVKDLEIDPRTFFERIRDEILDMTSVVLDKFNP